MRTKDKRTITISRNPQKVETETSRQPEKKPLPEKKGIILASAQQETDTFKIELFQKGYSIISENEYGVIVRKAIGKPTFLPRTKYGYFEEGKPNNLRLPESINTVMKMHVANLGINAQQYLTQLIMKDLSEKNLL